MDINLPLILMIAVVVTGVVWLGDSLLLAKSRRRAAEQVDQQYAHLPEDKKRADQGYLAALHKAIKEPLVVEYSKSFFPILAIVFVLRSFLIEPFKIPSESMVPTLEVGDFIVVNKYAYGIRLPVFRTKIMDLGSPQRGDVVVFFPPHEDRYFIKRLIGVPGDKIQLRDNVLYVNGVKMEQEFLGKDPVSRYGAACWGDYQIVNETIDGKKHLVRKCPTGGQGFNERTWTVPDGHYFMMGDNRDNSLDSRVWTDPFVPDRNIVGKAFAVWMHWNEGLPSFGRAGSIK
ncbi:MAG: signal peptidase I [Cellvibrionaceae bacterium]|nr:signal peptidase I [Cellvibrionaceae bacterium]